LLSTAIDSGITSPSYTGVTIRDTPNGGTIRYQFAGSNDNFVSDNTGWVNQNQIAQLNGKRYLKYQVQLQAGVRTASPLVSSIAVAAQTPQFNYQLAGCARVREPSPGPAAPLEAILFIAYLMFLPRLFRPQKPKPAKAQP
jgi:hypothetical protein